MKEIGTYKKTKCCVCLKFYAQSKMLPGKKYCSSDCLIKDSKISAPRVKRLPMVKVKLKERDLSKKKCVSCNVYFSSSNKHNYCSKKCRRKETNKFKDLRNKRMSIDLYSKENVDRWLALRFEVFSKYKRECMACGNTNKLEVDHIKPKSRYPELSFEFDNLQILCAWCNHGKGDEKIKDFRPK